MLKSTTTVTDAKVVYRKLLGGQCDAGHPNKSSSRITYTSKMFKNHLEEFLCFTKKHL